MPASLSILIITYNRPEDTLALLENLNEQSHLTEHVGEILLLNNHSTESYKAVKTFILNHTDLPIKYIEHDENLGVARGRNFLIKKAQYPYLVMMDDDMVFPAKEAMAKLAGYFDKAVFKENRTAIITFKVCYFSTHEQQRNALPHKHFEEYKNKSQFLTYYFSGGAHVVKKSVFDEVGLYPENFFYGMEEYDLSYRLINAGYALAYDNEVTVLHKESPTGRVPTAEKLAMMWYNKCVVAQRYLPPKYFYTTALMWCFQYLKKTKGDIRGSVKTIRKILGIRQSISATKISMEALRYLKKVKARLWY